MAEEVHTGVAVAVVSVAFVNGIGEVCTFVVVGVMVVVVLGTYSSNARTLRERFSDSFSHALSSSFC